MNGFYWIYVVMIAFLLYYGHVKTQEQKRLTYYAACGFLILIFVAQDFSVSIDIAEYMRQWAIIPNLSFSEMLVHKFEIGYVLLCYFLERTFDRPDGISGPGHVSACPYLLAPAGSNGNSDLLLPVYPGTAAGSFPACGSGSHDLPQSIRGFHWSLYRLQHPHPQMDAGPLCCPFCGIGFLR